MKSCFIAVLLILCCVTGAFAGSQERTGGQTAINVIAPQGALQKLLTVVSVTYDMTKNVQWLIYSPTACKVRTMATSAKGTYKTGTIPVTTFVNRGVNLNTPFVNFTGCTNGELYIQ